MRHNTSLRDKVSQAAGWILAGCALIAVIVITAIVSSIDNALGAGLLFVGLLVGGFLSIAAHELGHAAAAWLVGWRLWIISVLGVVQRPSFAPCLSAKLSHDAGGYVLASPPTAARDSRWRSIIVSAGGPLVSVATGPLFIAWLVTLPREGWETPLGVGVFASAIAFGGASTISALITILPSRGRGGRPNDMAMILDAAFKRDPSVDVRGVSWAWALFEHGVEPSAWPPWMRESVTRSAGNPWASPVAPLLAFFCALETSDEASARIAAKSSTHDVGKLMRAYVYVYFDRDAQSAKAELKAVQISPHDETLVLLREFVLARISTLSGDARAAGRAHARIDEELNSGAPKPFWRWLRSRST
jgi:hypothetical protein